MQRKARAAGPLEGGLLASGLLLRRLGSNCNPSPKTKPGGLKPTSIACQGRSSKPPNDDIHRDSFWDAKAVQWNSDGWRCFNISTWNLCVKPWGNRKGTQQKNKGGRLGTKKGTALPGETAPTCTARCTRRKATHVQKLQCVAACFEPLWWWKMHSTQEIAVLCAGANAVAAVMTPPSEATEADAPGGLLSSATQLSWPSSACVHSSSHSRPTPLCRRPRHRWGRRRAIRKRCTGRPPPPPAAAGTGRGSAARRFGRCGRWLRVRLGLRRGGVMQNKYVVSGWLSPGTSTVAW